MSGSLDARKKAAATVASAGKLTETLSRSSSEEEIADLEDDLISVEDGESEEEIVDDEAVVIVPVDDDDDTGDEDDDAGDEKQEDNSGQSEESSTGELDHMVRDHLAETYFSCGPVVDGRIVVPWPFVQSIQESLLQAGVTQPHTSIYHAPGVEDSSGSSESSDEFCNCSAEDDDNVEPELPADLWPKESNLMNVLSKSQEAQEKSATLAPSSSSSSQLSSSSESDIEEELDSSSSSDGACQEEFEDEVLDDDRLIVSESEGEQNRNWPPNKEEYSNPSYCTCTNEQSSGEESEEAVDDYSTDSDFDSVGDERETSDESSDDDIHMAGVLASYKTCSKPLQKKQVGLAKAGGTAAAAAAATAGSKLKDSGRPPFNWGGYQASDWRGAWEKYKETFRSYYPVKVLPYETEVSKAKKRDWALQRAWCDFESEYFEQFGPGEPTEEECIYLPGESVPVHEMPDWKDHIGFVIDAMASKQPPTYSSSSSDESEPEVPEHPLLKKYRIAKIRAETYRATDYQIQQAAKLRKACQEQGLLNPDQPKHAEKKGKATGVAKGNTKATGKTNPSKTAALAGRKTNSLNKPGPAAAKSKNTLQAGKKSSALTKAGGRR